MELHELVSRVPNFHSSSQAEKVKLFGYYLHSLGQEKFTTGQIIKCFDSLAVQPPANTSKVLKDLTERRPPVVLRNGEGFVLELQSRNAIRASVEPITPSSLVLDKIRALIREVPDQKEKEYLEEAARCVGIDAWRAAIVLGWCATIHHLQKKVEAVGFATFNAASTMLKNQTTGKYKRWNKEFDVQSVPELQKVFDTDLIIVLEGMGVFDGNETERLETNFQYRCHGAHPGEAPIGDAHLLAFFTDVVKIVLTNPKATA